MDALQKAQEHFKAQLAGELKSVDVPEWGEQVYYGAETLQHRDRYYALLAAKKLEGYVELLIARARYKDGRPMFKPSDKGPLMNSVDPDVVVRVALHIFTDGNVVAAESEAETEVSAAKKS